MKFIDIPKPVARQDYEDLKSRLIDKLDLNLVESVYQIGSVGHPGISDLDMVVVFKEGVSYRENPRANMNAGDSQILTHGLFGGNVDLFERSFKYSFFHNYDLLWGKDLRPSTSINPQDLTYLKRQIALEYLLKFYLVLGVQKWYGMLKLRTFLLEAKAIAFDLDFLDYPANHPLRESTNQVIEMRNLWFDENRKPKMKEVKALVNKIYAELEDVLRAEFEKDPLFLLANSPADFNLNTKFVQGSGLSLQASGLPLSRIIQVDDKRFFNVMHRINSFKLTFPWTWEQCPAILKERYDFAKEFASYNKENLPYFSPIVSILKVFS